MGRLDAARRVVQRFHRRRLSFQRRDIVVIGEGGEPTKVTISDLRVKDRRIHLRGSTTAKIISFATELGFRSVSPEDGQGEFEVELDGSIQLVLRVNGESRRYPVRMQTRLQSLTSGIASAMALFGVLSHWRDIWDYMVLGDSGAGDRLEFLLDPPERTEPLPKARKGLFFRGPEPVKLTEVIDIIVPVFNAFEDTKRCLDHLSRHTLPMHRVHIIEDCSTDRRILPLVRNWSAKRPNSTLTVNEENRGFIESVNIGFKHASGHVVLLNTDAFVPEGWLERLMQPILSDLHVASVTPMSSDAEILTAPVECSRFLPAAGQAEFVDTVARKLNPEVASADLPTGVGYCMALSRNWLERVPEFDRAFGRGYGEEVDWCRKVAEQGARHIGIGNLYVEHRGGGSFEAEKSKRIQANNRRIETLYPGYDQLVAAFRKGDPLIAPRLALAVASIENGTPVPVYVAQRVGGGSEAWLDQQICDHLTDGDGVIVIRHGQSSDVGAIEVHTHSGVTSGAIAFAELGSYLTIAERLQINYSGLVTARAPLEALENCLSFIRACDQLNVFFHDYFPICPSYNLISADGEFCALPEINACQSCYLRLAQTTGQRPEQISEWRQAWALFLRRAEELVVFSEASAAILECVWPEFSDNVRVRPHIPITVPRLVKRGDAKAPVLGVLGSIGYNKGAEVLKKVAEVSQGRFRIAVIGKLDPAFRHKNIEVHGAYDSDQISELAETYDVSGWLLPSIWPETFCYAAHECLATGLPVLCFNIGAHADAIRTHPNGIVLPLSTTPEEIAKTFLGTVRSTG